MSGQIEEGGMGERVRFMGFECDVLRLAYANGGTCLQLADAEDGEPVATATTWVPGLAPDEVAVKDYSENAGMLDALLAGGVVEPPHRSAGLLHVCHLATREG